VLPTRAHRRGFGQFAGHELPQAPDLAMTNELLGQMAGPGALGVLSTSHRPYRGADVVAQTFLAPPHFVNDAEPTGLSNTTPMQQRRRGPGAH
jgi:hypothetical protein